ncbi:18115_t:CDS:2 [Funneliformis geosporum]|uniref:1404_t:CDS:1 n=1 Tax=Funneliformis geosporum TaxID=1117311 RepID=A0A9W4T0B4_9GLOM|nr:1404_t:CDS:2 [Funneliformis geosporum]CAI2189335.1 18115_t:CDS:2 [Funneliformis geosporum]
MLELFASTCEKSINYQTELKMLHAENKLFYKIQIFVNDLLTFGSSENARFRLKEDPTAKFFFSCVYFNEDEIAYFLGFPTPSGLPFSKLLNVVLSDKIGLNELCSSHDLAPLVQQVFGIRKGFKKKKSASWVLLLANYLDTY